jgi:hypothetical protein
MLSKSPNFVLVSKFYKATIYNESEIACKMGQTCFFINNSELQFDSIDV